MVESGSCWVGGFFRACFACVLNVSVLAAPWCRLVNVCQAIEAAKVDKTDKPFSEMKIISIDIS